MRIKVNSLYRLIITFNIIMMLTIINTIIVKISISYHKVYEFLNERDDYLINFLPSELFLKKYEEIFSWYHTPSISYTYYYITHLIFLFTLTLGLLIFRSFFINLLNIFLLWAAETKNTQIRNKIIFFYLFMFFCFVSKTHTGLMFGGISGWDHQKVQSTIHEQPINVKGLQQHDFLKKAILIKNLKYQTKVGFISDYAMFIHYGLNKTLPINMGVLDMVFPLFHYRISEKNFTQNPRFLEHFKYSYNRKRSKSEFFKKYSYPAHTPYYKINYDLYPEFKTIDSITIYKINVEISHEELNILGGELIQTIKNEI